MKIDNKSVDRVEHLNNFRRTQKDQNSIQEEINSRLVRQCLLSIGAESFVFQFSIQKYNG
jgi:hypothetical protein